MKILLQVALVFGIYWVGQGIEAVLPFAFPASVISLLLLLVLLSIGTMLTVQHQTKALLEQLDNLESIVDTGDLEAAEAPFTEFTAQWEQTERILNFMVWRDRIVSVDETISHLDPMCSSDCDELKSELQEARMWIQRLRQGEFPLLRNIF